MARANGKTTTPGDPDALDVSHELPAGEQDDPATEVSSSADSAVAEEVASLRDQVRRLQAERDTLLERMARAQAEFDNARKRDRRQQAEQREYAIAEALRTLLPFIDSLDLALESGAATGELRTGLELIHRQLHDGLNRLGVKVIHARGKPFDPNFHQAVEMVETNAVPDHQVIDELQRGYMLKDRLLRPAMVRVAKKK